MKAVFLENKLRRAINTQGEEFEFTQMTVDEYNQPIESPEKLLIKGVYHEQNSFIVTKSVESAQVQKKKAPMILTLYDDNVKKLSQGAKVIMEGVVYKVAGVLNIQNLGIAADISLEMEV